MADKSDDERIVYQREQQHTLPIASPSPGVDTTCVISTSETNTTFFLNALHEQSLKSSLTLQNCVFFVLAEGEVPEYPVLHAYIRKGVHIFLIILLQERVLSPHRREEKAELLRVEVLTRAKIRLKDIYVLSTVPATQKIQEMAPLLQALSTVSSSKSEYSHSNLTGNYPPRDASARDTPQKYGSTFVKKKPEGKKATKRFDVFLCYNWEDQTIVQQRAEQLKQQGLSPWFDEWEIQPGLSWQRALEAQIEQIRSAAVFVGRAGIGPWQRQEIDAFLREFVQRGCPVIPVLLEDTPNEPGLPVFLRGMKWVDFRKQRPNPMEQLLCGITGQRPIR